MNGDADQSSASLQIARKLLGRQSGSADSNPAIAAAALQQTCARVCDSLRDALGMDGCSALLTRALADVATNHPALVNVRPAKGDGVYLDGVKESVETHGVTTVTAAIEAMLAAVIDILGRLIGGDMATRLIEHDAPRSRRGGGAQAP